MIRMPDGGRQQLEAWHLVWPAQTLLDICDFVQQIALRNYLRILWEWVKEGSKESCSSERASQVDAGHQVDLAHVRLKVAHHTWLLPCVGLVALVRLVEKVAFISIGWAEIWST